MIEEPTTEPPKPPTPEHALLEMSAKLDYIVKRLPIQNMPRGEDELVEVNRNKGTSKRRHIVIEFSIQPTDEMVSQFESMITAHTGCLFSHRMTKGNEVVYLCESDWRKIDEAFIEAIAFKSEFPIKKVFFV